MERRELGIRLRVGDASLEDVAEERARISREAFDALGLEPEDIVRIIGQHSVLARAHLAGVEDDGLGLVRLDGGQRRTLRVSLGELVTVLPYAVAAARRLRVAVLGSARSVELSSYDLRSALRNRPITTGESLMIAPARRDFQANVSVLGLSLVDVVGSSSGAHAVLIRVIETDPPGVVRLADDTEIEFLPAGDVDE